MRERAKKSPFYIAYADRKPPHRKPLHAKEKLRKPSSPPPSAHLRLFWREKKIKFLFPAATEENIARVNWLRKASDSSILMAIDALDAILSIHLLPLAKI